MTLPSQPTNSIQKYTKKQIRNTTKSNYNPTPQIPNFNQTLNLTTKKPFLLENSQYSHIIKTTSKNTVHKISNLQSKSNRIHPKKYEKKVIGKKNISFSAMTSPVRSPVKIKNSTQKSHKYNLLSKNKNQLQKGSYKIKSQNFDYLKNQNFQKSSGRFKKFEPALNSNQNFFKKLDSLDQKSKNLTQKNYRIIKRNRDIDHIAQNLNRSNHYRVKSSNLRFKNVQKEMDIEQIHKNLVSNSKRSIQNIK
jgi:hypothetical protein